jgi:hypothetical protein
LRRVPERSLCFIPCLVYNDDAVSGELEQHILAVNRGTCGRVDVA